MKLQLLLSCVVIFSKFGWTNGIEFCADRNESRIIDKLKNSSWKSDIDSWNVMFPNTPTRAEEPVNSFDPGTLRIDIKEDQNILDEFASFNERNFGCVLGTGRISSSFFNGPMIIVAEHDGLKAISKIQEEEGYFESYLSYVPADFGHSHYGDILFFEIDIMLPMRRL